MQAHRAGRTSVVASIVPTASTTARLRMPRSAYKPSSPGVDVRRTAYRRESSFVTPMHRLRAAAIAFVSSTAPRSSDVLGAGALRGPRARRRSVRCLHAATASSPPPVGGDREAAGRVRRYGEPATRSCSAVVEVRVTGRRSARRELEIVEAAPGDRMMTLRISITPCRGRPTARQAGAGGA
jgi:hypothetical protein